MLLQENVYSCRLSGEISQKPTLQISYGRFTETIPLLSFRMTSLNTAENYQTPLTLTVNVTLGSYKAQAIRVLYVIKGAVKISPTLMEFIYRVLTEGLGRP